MRLIVNTGHSFPHTHNKDHEIDDEPVTEKAQLANLFSGGTTPMTHTRTRRLGNATR